MNKNNEKDSNTKSDWPEINQKKARESEGDNIEIAASFLSFLYKNMNAHNISTATQIGRKDPLIKGNNPSGENSRIARAISEQALRSYFHSYLGASAGRRTKRL